MKEEEGFIESGALLVGGAIAILGAAVFWVGIGMGKAKGEAALLGGPMVLFGGMISAGAMGLAMRTKKGGRAARVTAGIGLGAALSVFFYIAS